MLGAEAEEGGAESYWLFVDSVFDELEEFSESFFEGLGWGLPDDVVVMGVVGYLMSLTVDFLDYLGLTLRQLA